MELESYEEPFGAKIFKLILYVIIGLLGVIGNILVCIVILKTAKLRSSTYYFICSLAIADIGVLLVCFSLAVIEQELLAEWPFGEGFCLYIYPATDTAFGASIWSITVIAIERYRVIVANRPKIITRNSKKRRYTWIVIAVVWLGNFLLAGIPLYVVIKYHEDSIKKVCYSEWKFKETLKTVYFLALTLVWYIIPLGIISFTYWAISRKIKERAEFLARIGMRGPREAGDLGHDHTSLRHEHKNCLKRDAKAQRLLTPLVVVFAVTMFPINLFRIIIISWYGFSEWEYYRLFYDIMIFFTISNSAANPIIYTVVSNEFRTGFGNLLHLNQLKRCTDSQGDSGITNITNLSGIIKIITPQPRRKHQNEGGESETFRRKKEDANMVLSDNELVVKS